MLRQGSDQALPPGFFVDNGGRLRSFPAAYGRWFDESGRDPHYVRALIEMGILVGIGLSDYWIRPGINRNDWDLPAFTDRLTFQAVRFDNNLALTNFVGHPMAGAAYYGFGRLNDLSPPIAFLFSAFTSAFWEYVLEWREQVSINDMIFTPTGGMPIGAFFFQLTDYLNSAPGGGGGGNKAFSYSLGFARHLQPRDLDPNTGDGRLPADSLGFSSAFWHSFRLGYDASFVKSNGSEYERIHTIVIDGNIVAMPGFLRPGRFRRIFASDNFTELHARLGFSGNGFQDTDLRADSSTVGYYVQNFDLGPHGVYGHGEMVGLASGLRYVERYYAGGHDMYASTHLPGATSALWFGVGPLRGHVEAELRYDFASVHSLALPAYVDRHGVSALKSALTVQGYQFGMGPAEKLEVDLEMSMFSIGGYVDHSYYRAIGGLDRMQLEMKGDVSGSDDILEYGAWLMGRVPGFPVYARGFADFIARESVLGEITARRVDKRVGVGGGLVF